MPRIAASSVRRILIATLVPVATVALAYWAWSPGLDVADGRHDRGRNGIWLQHGWLGDDAWFARNQKQHRPGQFRDPARIAELVSLLRRHGIVDVFPHLCPADPAGSVAPCDAEQVERFLDAFAGFRVLPWVGGVQGVHVRPGDATWRRNFCASVRQLLEAHPRLAGIHLNVEPLPSGDADFLRLLDELRPALPARGVLSVAAYPPPTRWHPFPAVHWDEGYFREVSRRADQMAVMLYDTALRSTRLYEHLMSQWTRETLAWAEGKSVLLGLPAYEDAGSGYHHPRVENLRHALRGVHAGLSGLDPLPPEYQGVAIYAEWEMTTDEWSLLRERFVR